MPTKKPVASPVITQRPSTEVAPRKATIPAAQRLALLAEYESYPKGDPRRGELLRRHGLYSSHMSKWREQRDRGALSLTSQPSPGRPQLPPDPQCDEIARLQREVARLQHELHKATTIIDVQKKMATLLGLEPTTLPSDGS